MRYHDGIWHFNGEKFATLHAALESAHDQYIMSSR